MFELTFLAVLALVLAGSMWVAYRQGYEAGMEDRDEEYATVRAIRTRNPETDPYNLRSDDGGHNDR